MDVLQEIRTKEFACPKCGLDSLLQNVAMEIHPQVQKLSESNGVQTARDVKKDADCSGGLNLFEAKIAFRLGEIHIYLKKHPIQTSEFQSFWDR